MPKLKFLAKKIKRATFLFVSFCYMEEFAKPLSKKTEVLFTEHNFKFKKKGAIISADILIVKIGKDGRIFYVDTLKNYIAQGEKK